MNGPIRKRAFAIKKTKKKQAGMHGATEIKHIKSIGPIENKKRILLYKVSVQIGIFSHKKPMALMNIKKIIFAKNITTNTTKICLPFATIAPLFPTAI